ncbi:MAG: PAS domain-containing protein, partial [Anaerolineales bacterium]|nr:PAS domain-containing protein [Anaerolineales bacterium]
LALMAEPAEAELVVLARDVTEARRASEERFQQAAELAVDYAYALRLTPAGGYELEWEAGQLAAVPSYSFRATKSLAAWQALVYPDDWPAMLAQQQRLLAGETVDFVVRVGGPDGRLHWLQHYSRPRYADGQVAGYVGVVRDVTARYTAEAALRASEERYRLISELSTDYAFANRIEPDGRVAREWITDAFTRITGYGPEEIVSLNDWQAIVHAQDWPLVVKAFSEAAQGGTTTADYRIKTAAGEERWLRVRARGFPEARRTVGAVSDVTDQKRAEQALRAQARRLAILHDLSRSILAARAPAEIARSALLHLNALVPVAGWALWVRGPEGRPTVLLAGLGQPLAAPPADLDLAQLGGAAAFGPWPAYSSEAPLFALRVPLRAAGQNIGLLVAADLAAEPFTASDLELAEEVADEVAIAVHQRRLQEAENQRRLELEALAVVSAALRQATSIGGVQQSLTEQLVAVVRAQGGALLLQEEGWVLAAAAGQVALPVGARLAVDWATRLSQRVREDTAAAAWSEAGPDLAALFTAILPGLPAGGLLQLRGADRLPAVILLGWSAPRLAAPSETQLLTAIAEIGSNALQRSNLLDTLERRVAERTRELTSLYEVAAVANQAAPAGARLAQALALTLEAVGAEAGAVYEAEADVQSLRLLAHQGPVPAMLDHLGRVAVETSLTGRVLRTGEPVIVNDLIANQPVPPGLEAWAGLNWRYIGLPLRSRGQVLGVLGVVGRSEAHLSAESMSLLSTIADQLGTLLEAERLRRQAERAAVAEERQRLARDLHDSVTQSMYSALLFVAAAQEQLDQAAPERARLFLGRIDAILGQALREMRLLIYELRPAALEALGLARALQHRLDAVEGHANVKAQLQVDGDCRLPPAEEETLYAVAQEALNNALKHAGARAVRVSLRGAPERVTLMVEDDGRGFDLATAGAR